MMNKEALSAELNMYITAYGEIIGKIYFYLFLYTFIMYYYFIFISLPLLFIVISVSIFISSKDISEIINTSILFIGNKFGPLLGIATLSTTGIGLYLLRERNREIYSALELLLALYLGSSVAKNVALYISAPAITGKALNLSAFIGAVYFTVRGLDNWCKARDEKSKTKNYTFLMRCAYRGDSLIMRLYISNFLKDILNRALPAIPTENPVAAELLLVNKEVQDILNKKEPISGMTPLMIAIKMNRGRTVNALLELGANPSNDLKNNADDYAYKLAIKNENPAIISMISDAINKWDKQKNLE